MAISSPADSLIYLPCVVEVIKKGIGNRRVSMGLLKGVLHVFRGQSDSSSPKMAMSPMSMTRVES